MVRNSQIKIPPKRVVFLFGASHWIELFCKAKKFVAAARKARQPFETAESAARRFCRATARSGQQKPRAHRIHCVSPLSHFCELSQSPPTAALRAALIFLLRKKREAKDKEKCHLPPSPSLTVENSFWSFQPPKSPSFSFQHFSLDFSFSKNK